MKTLNKILLTRSSPKDSFERTKMRIKTLYVNASLDSDIALGFLSLFLASIIITSVFLDFFLKNKNKHSELVIRFDFGSWRDEFSFFFRH